MIIKLLFLPWTLFRNALHLFGYLLARCFFALGQWLGRKQKLYVRLKLESNYLLGVRQKGWQKWFGDDITTYLELRQQLKLAATHPSIEGMIVDIDGMGMGQARKGDVLDLLGQVKQASRHMVMHTKEASLSKLHLMSLADDVLLTPAGRLYTFGMRMELPFYHALFERVGIQPQFIHLGAFKTATHQFHKTGATTPQRLMMRQLFDGLKDHMVHGISAMQGVEHAAVLKAIEDAPVDTHEARRLGLIQGQCFKRDVSTWIENKLSPDVTDEEKEDRQPLIQITDLTDFEQSIPRFTPRPIFKRQRYMAVMDLTGPILTGGDGPSLPGGGGSQINPDEVIPVLERLKKDRRCMGLLLHINSPGGSALGSDLIWRAIVSLREKMPVVAYCSDVAASGGYYLAVGADHIICRPESIMGSIGVIVGKFAIPGVINHLDIHVDAIYDEGSSAFQSLYTPLDDHVMTQLRDDARIFYRRFLERVGQARNIERRRMHRYGRGRVYLGHDALTRGLVDELSGFEGAVAKLYGLAQTTEKNTPLIFVGHRKQSIRQALTSSMMTPNQKQWIQTAQDKLVTPAMLFEQASVLALMPSTIKVD